MEPETQYAMAHIHFPQIDWRGLWSALERKVICCNATTESPSCQGFLARNWYSGNQRVNLHFMTDVTETPENKRKGVIIRSDSVLAVIVHPTRRRRPPNDQRTPDSMS